MQNGAAKSTKKVLLKVKVNSEILKTKYQLKILDLDCRWLR